MLIALQLTYTIFTIIGPSTVALVAAQALSLTAYALFSVLSFLEHGRSITTSTLLTVYLFSSMLCDVIQFGLLYAAQDLSCFSALPSAIVIVKLALLICETQNKTSILREPYRDQAPEDRAGLFETAFFWWVNEFLALGHSKILSIDDMPPLPSYLDAGNLREDMQKAWDKRSEVPCPVPRISIYLSPLTKIVENPEHRFTLLFTQFKLLWRPNIQIVIPRLLFTACRYCQPILITRIISYVGNDLLELESRNEAFRLILFAFVIYIGMAVCSQSHLKRNCFLFLRTDTPTRSQNACTTSAFIV